MPTIAKRITKARKALGLNQRELALKSDITESTLSRFERSTREPIADVRFYKYHLTNILFKKRYKL